MGKGPLEVQRRRPARSALRVSDSAACVAGLQIFKFSVYVTIPVLLTVAFAASPQNLQAVITNVRAGWLRRAGAHAARRLCASHATTARPPQRAYVVYPTEGPRPPSADEIRKMRQR